MDDKAGKAPRKDSTEATKKRSLSTTEDSSDEEEQRRKDLEARIPLKHYEFTSDELVQIDHDIQERFRKEGALQKLVDKRKKEEAARNAGDDLVDTDEE